MSILRALAGLLACGLLLMACSSEKQDTVALAAQGAQTFGEPLENVYGLFVGIDAYRYSRAQLSFAEFDDLRGAVGDVRRFKNALREFYGLQLDETEGGECKSQNQSSTTLLDACATRGEILAELDARIEALGPGDTLLFYFAGHGSQYRDDEVFDQDSGYNGTILPHDARNPDGSPGEIFDIELKARKDRATAKGIYFVSIFDSCNSGTATRDGALGQSRSVPVSTAPPPPPEPEATAQTSTEPVEAGYWVHLAAAQDGQEAQEASSGEVGERAGVFTNALIEAMRMPDLRYSSFGDTIREVQLRVAGDGRTSQVPSAEGELTAALGSRARPVIVFDARAQGNTVTLDAGELSGMTKGSRFALYATQTDAINRENALAHATIASLTPTSAWLQLESEPDAPLPQVLFAEELAHFIAPDSLTVTNILDGVDRAAVADVLEAIEFVEVAAVGEVQVAPDPAQQGAARLLAADGTVLAALGTPGDPAFAKRLESELIKIARVNQLLALRTTGRSALARGEGDSEQGGVAFCIATDGYPAFTCPGIENRGIRQFERGEMTRATVINRTDEPLHIYILAIDPRNAVIQVLPRSGEIDAKIEPNRPYGRGPISFAEPGVYRFVTIASEQRIRVDALQQSGSGTRNVGACRNPLERLLCSASKGTRDPSVKSVGNWYATVSSAMVE